MKIAKYVLGFLGALAFVCPLHATTTVTGKMQNLGTGNVTSAAFMRFWLRGCAGNQPRINGTSLIAPTLGGVYYFDIAADSSGNISGTLYSTRDSTGLLGGDIECGGSTTAVWYGMQAFQGGRGGPEIPVHAKNGVSLDITNVTPITTNPVATAPTGDSTYLRLDAGNVPVTGKLTVNHAGGVDVTAGNINNIFYVDGVKYTTVQAAITAACAASPVGTVIVPPGTYTGPTTWCSNLTVRSLGPPFSGNTTGAFGLSPNPAVAAVVFTYTAQLTFTNLMNVQVSNIIFDWNNLGFGFGLVSSSANFFDGLTLSRAGGTGVPALSLTTNGSTGATNTVLNIFNNLTVLANGSGSAAAATCIYLNGSGAVNAGVAVTLNRWTGLTTCAGGVFNGWQQELNTDSNIVDDLNINQDLATYPAGAAPLVFNSLTPGSDQDSDGTIINVIYTGPTTVFIRAGSTTGSIIRTVKGGIGVPAITSLGGTQNFRFDTVGLPGVYPEIGIAGRISAFGSSALAPVVGSLAGDIAAARSASQGELYLGTDGSGLYRNANTASFTYGSITNDFSSFNGTLSLIGANGISAGTVTLSAGAGSHAFATNYASAPICTATDTTSAAAVKVTSTTSTITLAGTGTDVIAWQCSLGVN